MVMDDKKKVRGVLNSPQGSTSQRIDWHCKLAKFLPSFIVLDCFTALKQKVTDSHVPSSNTLTFNFVPFSYDKVLRAKDTPAAGFQNQ